MNETLKNNDSLDRNVTNMVAKHVYQNDIKKLEHEVIDNEKKTGIFFIIGFFILPMTLATALSWLFEKFFPQMVENNFPVFAFINVIFMIFILSIALSVSYKLLSKNGILKDTFTIKETINLKKVQLLEYSLKATIIEKDQYFDKNWTKFFVKDNDTEETYEIFARVIENTETGLKDIEVKKSTVIS